MFLWEFSRIFKKFVYSCNEIFDTPPSDTFAVELVWHCWHSDFFVKLLMQKKKKKMNWGNNVFVFVRVRNAIQRFG